ncbi:hypothetical protein Vretimale_13482 [Volvox reticuliferus]|uniref:Guanylate cyclase domain-containing protein n=1 Tax=Volvox reticuliferus TaxID=1737510 RepID=A0A8J4FCG7_9CHLO|nr:hypothetical protein Vretifemale_330 [Volvox reticuliferus]GIL69363.1 hypothetical protein Vretifemale_330 [Volvox reticuliferus]GIM09638.1 hypothetical protein Vretimale_13482 [Volvox reticuliferus]GIM09639.1 hypothetical protein Vretimale_13482 [Volvox reticuliferus]
MVNVSSATSSEADPIDNEPDSTSCPSQQLNQPLSGAADGSAIVNNKDDEEGQPPPLRSMSSFRARLRAGRREAGPPVPMFQWETRAHFWSALDKATAPKDSSQARTGLRGVLVRAWQRTKVRAKNTATVVRLQPSVLLWPLLLCAVCLTGGIIGVELGAKHHEDLIKVDVTAAANEALSSLDLVWSQSLQPLASLELHVVLSPRMGQLGPRFPNISQLMLREVPPVLSALMLAPFGVVAATYPASTSASSSLGTLVGQPLPTLEFPFTPATVQDLMLQPFKGSSATPLTLLASRPVLIGEVPQDEDWGNGPGPDGQSIATCTSPACYYQPSGGIRLWGFAEALLDLGALASQPDAGPKRLDERGFLYRITLLSSNNPSAAPVAIVNSMAAIPSGAQTVLVRATVPGTNQLLQLEIYPVDGWEAYWRAPLLAAVVILSVAVTVMQFAAMVLQRRHVMFLEAMLPKQVIGVLGMGRTFYHHYDMVTVLYADIVRYSNTPTGMPPWEIVKLLNDVNNIYDNLLEKHGLVKIRRSGEAFMAVGGCPEAGDSVAVAVRVAMCAREMVMATAGFRSSAGQRVQIRLGLHSGPAVAAVLGIHTPRFSLLGDTVDIAHFMESTSTIMGVHVSDTTAELLNIADDPLISLQPRGIIDIKGRGPITTSWLRIDLLAPMGTWNGEHTDGFGAASTSAAAKDSGAGGRTSQGGGKAAAAAPADIACTADLAVAATLGVRGAPLVRKLSQTGLTQTRRTLPDRRQREGRGGDAFNNSLLGSFTMRLEPETISMLRDMLARPTPPPSPTHAARRRGNASSGGGSGVTASGIIAAPVAKAVPVARTEEDVAAKPVSRNDAGLGAEAGAEVSREASVSPGVAATSQQGTGHAGGSADGAAAGSGARLPRVGGAGEDGVVEGSGTVAKSGVAAAASLEIEVG